jgi:hypothetical protein
MTCSSYLDFIKTNTLLKYDAYPKGWTDDFLMIVDEGPSFQGWPVDFGLPDGRTFSAFVPKIKGLPAPAPEKVRTAEPKENCLCLELTDEVATFASGRSWAVRWISCSNASFSDRKKIRAFLERSQGKYRKLIIDVRNNGGGLRVFMRT